MSTRIVPAEASVRMGRAAQHGARSAARMELRGRHAVDGLG